MLSLAMLAVTLLAAANGANDLSRGAAPLLAAGREGWRAAQIWCLGWTLVGSLCSGLLAAGVAHRFATRLAVVGAVDPAGIAVIAVAAFAWVRVCTARRLPVSTTHAILGAMLAVLWCTPGASPPTWPTLAHDFLLPLFSSPLIALALVMVLKVAARPLRVSGAGAPKWISSGLVGFSRGVNDSAKIWALILPLAPLAAGGNLVLPGIELVAAAMLLGGIVDGRRVSELLAFRITRLAPVDGLVVNISTAAIITLASHFGFPVASSHVVGGAVLGAGLAGRERSVNWRVMAEMAFGWALTLPAAALLALGLQAGRRLAGPQAVVPLVVASLVAVIAASRFGRRRVAARSLTRADIMERRVVFVCGGNTSRSPMAAAICAAEILRRLGLESGVSASSAGLAARVGSPMNTLAIAALAEIGVPALTHAATALDAATVARATLLLCMTDQQCSDLIARFPGAAAKTWRLSADGDIIEPVAGDAASFARLAADLSRLVGARVAGLVPATAA